MPVDGGGEDMTSEPENDDLEDDDIRDAVLVIDADSATAEQVVLQLILSRCDPPCNLPSNLIPHRPLSAAKPLSN